MGYLEVICNCARLINSFSASHNVMRRSSVHARISVISIFQHHTKRCQ